MTNYADVLANYYTSPERRIHAVFQLLVQKSEHSMNALINGLFNDPNPIVRHECAYSLGEFKNSKGSAALIKCINSDNNKFVVHEAALAVSNTGCHMALDHLKKLLNSNDKDIIDTAEISLQRLNNKINSIRIENQSLSFEDILLNHREEDFRIQAAFKLLEDNSDKAVEVLIQALHTEINPIVKHEIVFALGETASIKANDALIAVLRTENNAFVIHECLLSLATIGNIKSEIEIKKFLDSKDKNISLSAKIAQERLLN